MEPYPIYNLYPMVGQIFELICGKEALKYSIDEKKLYKKLKLPLEKTMRRFQLQKSSVLT